MNNQWKSIRDTFTPDDETINTLLTRISEIKPSSTARVQRITRYTLSTTVCTVIIAIICLFLYPHFTSNSYFADNSTVPPSVSEPSIIIDTTTITSNNVSNSINDHTTKSTTSNDASPKEDESNPTKNQLATLPPWDSLTTVEKFKTIIYRNKEYGLSSNKALSNDRVGRYLCEYEAIGYDYNKANNNEYHNKCSIYSIKGFLEDCVLAVRFAGSNLYYPYANGSYVPKTLGSFVKDLDLKNNLQIADLAVYEYKQDNQIVKENITLDMDNLVWQYLLYDSSILNEQNIVDVGNTIMTIDVYINGIDSTKCFLLTDKGYLVTNILETGKYFYMKKNINEFIDTVLQKGKRNTVTRYDINSNDNNKLTVSTAMH